MSDPPKRTAVNRPLSFTHEDMELFAAASGDRSPLHTDPAFARRTSFGECIVYGGLLSIGLLGLLPPEVLAGVRSVRSQFPGPVLPGEALTARAQSRDDRPGEWDVRLTGRGRLVAQVSTSTLDRPPAALDLATVLQRAADSAPSLDDEVIAGARVDDEAIASAGLDQEVIAGDYQVGPELRELARRFAVESLDPRLLEGIAWASSVVGMAIPDFDGLCAAVTIVIADAAAPRADPPALQWIRLRDYDERTDRLLIEGVLSDQARRPRCVSLIECFPFGPTPLPESSALSSEGPLEEAQGKVVVVGASRGVGAALVLALLNRGHTVHGIYSTSSGSADELTRLAGPYAARLSLHRIDAGDPAAVARIAAAVGPSIDGLALCAAPPPLPMRLTGESAGELAEYVARSIRLAAVPLASLMSLLERENGWALFCSASAVVDPRRDLPQFSAAKAALEGLARWVAATNPAARIIIARLPKLRTDLVNTPSGRRAAEPPEKVVASIMQRLTADDLSPGLSIVELDGERVSA